VETWAEKIELSLREQETSLFDLDQVIILYDVTNTYFEGQCKRNNKAKRGASKEKRFDAPLISVGLVLDSQGFVIRHDTSRLFQFVTNDSQTTK